MMRDKIIRIHWHSPIPFEDVLKSELTNTQGLYYITRIFGTKETSLYLGIARYHNTIRHRLESHRDKWLHHYRGQINVRVGYIIYPTNMSMDEKAEIINHAESAILYDPAHKKLFPENVDKRSSYSYSELYRIENEGDIYQLEPRIRMHEQE